MGTLHRDLILDLIPLTEELQVPQSVKTRDDDDQKPPVLKERRPLTTTSSDFTEARLEPVP